jgi:hypothetical protein|tara:strand:- start:48 stop:725 length:678 start_codon:yes stop_codon:yes gene_type:complete
VDVLATPVVVDFLGTPKVDGACGPRVELILGLMVLLSLALSTATFRPNFGTPGLGMALLVVAFFVNVGVAAVLGLVAGAFFRASEVFPAIGMDPTAGLLRFKKLLTGAVSGLDTGAVVFCGAIGPLALFGATVEGLEITLGFFKPKPVPILLAVFFRVDAGLGVPVPMVVYSVLTLFNRDVVAVEVFSSAFSPSVFIFVRIWSVSFSEFCTLMDFISPSLSNLLT